VSVPRLLVVTDLDGCLLDADTYSWDAARPALAGLARTGTPLVLCSGKTRAEMQALATKLALVHPFIVENGGAIVFPDGSFEGDVPGARREGPSLVLPLGAPRTRLARQLRELASLAGTRVRGFADMTIDELQHVTGLPPDAARLALEREYDEPFLVEDEGKIPLLDRAAAARGLQLSHGGRFHHLTGSSDKGLAVRTLLSLYRRAGGEWRSAGLGDAETDLPLLRSVERPVVVPRRDGSADPLLAAHLPEAERAPSPGPAGWNEAVLALLEGRPLPRLAEPAADGRG
jgi:mannosyl-3-phosphoglycerate phosphatase